MLAEDQFPDRLQAARNKAVDLLRARAGTSRGADPLRGDAAAARR